VEKYQKQAYSNLSLKISVEEILGFTIKKDLSQSDWGAKKLNKEQIACKLGIKPRSRTKLIPDRRCAGRCCCFETIQSNEGQTGT
jgi:hypothetical protein